MCSISSTINHYCRFGGGARAPPKRERPTQPGACSALESERKVGEELKTRNRELTGKIYFDLPNMDSFSVVV